MAVQPVDQFVDDPYMTGGVSSQQQQQTGTAPKPPTTNTPTPGVQQTNKATVTPQQQQPAPQTTQYDPLAWGSNPMGGSYAQGLTNWGRPPTDDELVWDDISGNYVLPSGEAYTGDARQNIGYSSQLPTYQSPLSGMTEAQKNAYWVGQGGDPSQVGAYNPADIATTTQAVQQAQQDYTQAYNDKVNPVANNLDEWWAQHGNGPRYININGSIVDQAQLSFGGIQNAAKGINTAPGDTTGEVYARDLANQGLLDDWQKSTDRINQAYDYATQHGGYYDTTMNPGGIFGGPDQPDYPFGGVYAPGDLPAHIPEDLGGTGPATQGPPLVSSDPSIPTVSNPNPGGAPEYQPPPAGGSPGGGGYAPTDTGGYVPPGGTTLPPPGPNTPGTSAPLVPPDTGLEANVTPLDPQKDLRSMQITPGALLDRFKLAQQQFGTYADATNPQFSAALRDATRAAAGAGRLGSGMLRTSYGDLANQRTQALTNERDKLFQDALLGSVNDAQTQFEDLLKSQGQQSDMQNQAFNQAISSADLQERLTSGQFQRALQQLTAGNYGSPEDLQMQLANIFGNQASGGGAALSGLFQGLAAGQNRTQQSGGDTSQFQQLLDLFRRGASGIGDIFSTGGGGGGSGDINYGGAVPA